VIYYDNNNDKTTPITTIIWLLP